MTLARAVKETLRGEGLALPLRSALAVTIITYAPGLWHVQVYARGEFYWLSDNLQTEARAREAEAAALKFVASGGRQRQARSLDWRLS